MKLSLIDKIHRLIYLTSVTIIGLGLLSFLLGMFFFDNYKGYPSFEKIIGLLILITPFAPIGTLFGTLKDSQTVRKKLIILFLTGLSVIFLFIFIWGSLFAVTLA
jgi:hypothetical protein